MGNPGDLILLSIPAGIATCAAWGAVVLYQAQENATPLIRVLMWLGIVIGVSIAIAIGSCYAWFLSGGLRL